MTYFESYLKKKALELDIQKGDILLGGRFKNVPHKVKELGTDNMGQPTVNGMKLLSFRIAKKMPKKAMEKTEGFHEWFKDQPRMLATTAPALLSGYALRSAGEMISDRAVKGLDKPVKSQLRDHMGALNDMPIKEVPGYSKAEYIAPESLENVIKQHGLQLSQNELENARKSGIVLHNPDYYKTAPIAKEIGKAQINREGGLGAFTQKWISPVSKYSSPAAALLGSTLARKAGLKIPGQIGVGAASGIAANAPHTISEYNAGNKGMTALRGQLSPEERKKTRQALATSLLTSAAAPVATAAISSGLRGAYHA